VELRSKRLKSRVLGGPILALMVFVSVGQMFILKHHSHVICVKPVQVYVAVYRVMRPCGLVAEYVYFEGIYCRLAQGRSSLIQQSCYERVILRRYAKFGFNLHLDLWLY
jgi:hypothetical protein